MTEFANHKKFNLMLWGGKDGKIKEVFLGSVANYVVQKSKIPLFIIK
jgi:nucleotide-binding universal stress UspA family protein